MAFFCKKYSNKVSLSSGYWGCTGNKFPSELSTFSTWKKECCQRFHDSMCIAESAEEFSTSSHELLIQVGTKPQKAENNFKVQLVLEHESRVFMIEHSPL